MTLVTFYFIIWYISVNFLNLFSFVFSHFHSICETSSKHFQMRLYHVISQYPLITSKTHCSYTYRFDPAEADWVIRAKDRILRQLRARFYAFPYSYKFLCPFTRVASLTIADLSLCGSFPRFDRVARILMFKLH